MSWKGEIEIEKLTKSKKEEWKKLKQELKELQIKAQPINTSIYLKECEIYELEESIKEGE